MSVAIPESHKKLLEGPVVVSLVTMMPDGQPQATPVWCWWDGSYVVINTAVGRQKDENLQANPKVTVLANNPENPYSYL
ncbi:MAG: pyridoxamine 5'-phosphate oxidase family protein [Anaerolineae bacterium]|nr:pyridoxamine 5'-phosphate oxidase family protein [Anaerolineae bacterium]